MQTNAPRRTEPTQSLLQGKIWTSPPATNVQDTWRKFGWVPPSEAKKCTHNPKPGDWLMSMMKNEWIAGTRQWCSDAAAELRRLHALNAELIHWMRYIQAHTHIGHIHDTASAAIAKAEAK